MQNSLYFADPDMTVCDTTILQVNKTSDGSDLALVDIITRPAGGGEPSDRGILRLKGQEFVFASATKSKGLTWVHIAGDIALAPNANDAVRVELDAAYRARRRRLHTGIHIFIRSFLSLADIEVTAAEIDNEAKSATITASVAGPIDEQVFLDVIGQVNEIVVNAMPVIALKAKSVDDARRQYGAQFRMSERHALSGKVRLIKIGDFDVNPCAGLHWTDTAIGPCGISFTPTRDGFRALLKIIGTV